VCLDEYELDIPIVKSRLLLSTMMDVEQRLFSVDGDILAVSVSNRLLAIAYSAKLVRIYRIEVVFTTILHITNRL
jgi:hypothetical protein